MKKLFFDFKFKWVHKNIVLDRNEENNQNQNRPSLLTINLIWQFTVSVLIYVYIHTHKVYLIKEMDRNGPKRTEMDAILTNIILLYSGVKHNDRDINYQNSFFNTK